MTHWARGKFQLTNPGKYLGKGLPTYRSSWEFSFFTFCDRNENVLEWASEPLFIPYRNPFTGKMTSYVPDILIRYRTRHNKVCTELIEIKPRKQSLIEGRMTQKDRMIVALNHHKWAAAQVWCRKQGIVFRVLNEDQLFHQGKS